MKNIFIPIIISFISGLSTILGIIPIYIKFKKSFINKFIVLSLSFTISIMIGISIFDLIPNSFIIITSKYPLSFFLSTSIIINIIIIIGTFLTKKITILNKGEGSSLFQLGIINMCVLMLHNFPEGVATFLSSYQNFNLGIRVSIAIMLHNIPEGICIAVPIYYATGSTKKAFQYTFISSLSEPLGAVLTYFFLQKYINDLIINIILLFTGFLMIFLSIEEILPIAKQYKEDRYMIVGGLLGIVIISISLII